MALLVHIIIAFGSLAYTTWLFFRPTKARFRVSYALVILTLASGTYLALAEPVHMVRACVMGLAYTSLALIGIILAGKKFARQNANVRF